MTATDFFRPHLYLLALFWVVLPMLFTACVPEDSAQTVPFGEIQKKLLAQNDDEVAYVKTLSKYCPSKIAGLSNPQHIQCVNWVAEQLANQGQDEAPSIWKNGRGKLISLWLIKAAPELVVAKQIYARELFLEGESDRAKKILESLETGNHASGFESFWLMQIARKEGNYELANEYAQEFEEYGSASPALHQNIQTMLKQEEAEQEIEADWFNYTSEHLNIRSPQEIADGEWLASTLEAKWAFIMQTLGINFSEKLEVVVYEENRHGGAAAQNEWVAASYNGKLRIPAKDIQKSQQFENLMVHELTHAVLDMGIGKDIPIWFHEGFAQYMEGRRIKRMNYPPLFPNGKNSIPSLSSLKKSFLHQADGREARKLYIISLAMVEEMIRSGNEEEFQNLISIAHQNRSFESAMGLISVSEQWNVSALYERAIRDLFPE